MRYKKQLNPWLISRYGITYSSTTNHPTKFNATTCINVRTYGATCSANPTITYDTAQPIQAFKNHVEYRHK